MSRFANRHNYKSSHQSHAGSALGLHSRKCSMPWDLKHRSHRVAKAQCCRPCRLWTSHLALRLWMIWSFLWMANCPRLSFSIRHFSVNFIALWPRSRSPAQRACDFRKPPTSIAVYWPLGCSSRWFPPRKLVQTTVICRSHVKNIWGTPKRWLIHAPEGLTFQSLTSFMLSSAIETLQCSACWSQECGKCFGCAKITCALAR